MEDDLAGPILFFVGVAVGAVFIFLLFGSFALGVKTADQRVAEKCTMGATIVIEGKAYECVPK